MRYRILFIFIICLGFFSCKKDASEAVNTEIIPEDPYVVPSDSIPERTSASALNLNEYQLFIDTTKTSVFYRNLDSVITSEEKKHQNAMFKLVELKKYKDQFLFYEPCDGTIRRYYISKEAIDIYGKHENVSFELKDFMIKAGNQVLFRDKRDRSLKLKEVNEAVLQLNYGEDSAPVYVTSVKNIAQFEMMVNNCLGKKVKEFDKFQE